MKRIITETVQVKEPKRERHPCSNMALLSLSRFIINRIVISTYRVTILDFMVQTGPKHLKIMVKGRAITEKVIKSFNITFANKTECPICIKEPRYSSI